MTTNSTPTEEAREIVDSCTVNAEESPNARVFITGAHETLTARITSALKAREEAGYNRGVRDAEKAAEGFHPCQDGCYCSGEIADEIEKLIKE